MDENAVRTRRFFALHSTARSSGRVANRTSRASQSNGERFCRWKSLLLVFVLDRFIFRESCEPDILSFSHRWRRYLPLFRLAICENAFGRPQLLVPDGEEIACTQTCFTLYAVARSSESYSRTSRAFIRRERCSACTQTRNKCENAIVDGSTFSGDLLKTSRASHSEGALSACTQTCNKQNAVQRNDFLPWCIQSSLWLPI